MRLIHTKLIHLQRVLFLGIPRKSNEDWKKAILTHKNQTSAIMTQLFSLQNQLSGPKHCPPPKNSTQSQPWLSTKYKIKKQVLEQSVFLHCFNPITPMAEADRSLVRPGWTVSWYLSHTQQQGDIVIQQSKAKTKHTKASMVICYGNSTFLSKRRHFLLIHLSDKN